MRRINGFTLGSALALSLASSSAFAGGFQRGMADTDILYEQGTVSSRFGVTYVNPNRGFSSVNGVEGDYGDYTGNYVVPSGAVAMGNDDVACAGTYTIPFAAKSDYSKTGDGALPPSPTAGSRVIENSFTTDEFGATCRISYSTENARFSFLGGIFLEDFRFTGTSQANVVVGQLPPAQGGLPVFLPVETSVDTKRGFDVGYRIGAAYERPEIALRAQVLYRSEVTHDSINGTGSVVSTGNSFVINPVTGGTVDVPSGIPTGATVATGTSAFNEVISPQTLTVNVQTGIAADTLLLASFRWTDWSTNRTAISSITTATGTRASESPYNWDDGYTVSLGLGHAFNDEISAAVAIGYDAGVSTGSETTYTDLYTLSGGVSFKQNKWSELRFGGLIGYWTSGDQRISDGAYFDGHVDDTFVYAGNASLKFSF